MEVSERARSRRVSRKRSEAPREPASTDLARTIDDYLNAKRAEGASLTTIRNAYGTPLLRSFLPWAVGQGVTRIEDVEQGTVDRYAVWLRDEYTKENGEPLAEASVWTYRKALKLFLSWWHGEDGKPPKIKLGQTPARDVDVLDHQDVRRLLKAARLERDRVIVELLANTGMRPGELVNLTVGGLTTQGKRRFFVHAEGKEHPRAKHKGGRDIEIRAELWRRIRALAPPDAEPGDPIFLTARRDPRTNQLEPLQSHGVTELVTRLGKESGLKGTVVPYTLRHSACRFMLLSGMSTVEVQRIMGHGSEAMIARHYANISEADAGAKLLRALRADGW